MKKIPSLSEFLSEGGVAGAVAYDFYSRQPKLSREVQKEVDNLMRVARALLDDRKNGDLAESFKSIMSEMVSSWPPEDDLANYFWKKVRVFDDGQIELLDQAVKVALSALK